MDQIAGNILLTFGLTFKRQLALLTPIAEAPAMATPTAVVIAYTRIKLPILATTRELRVPAVAALPLQKNKVTALQVRPVPVVAVKLRISPAAPMLSAEALATAVPTAVVTVSINKKPPTPVTTLEPQARIAQTLLLQKNKMIVLLVNLAPAVAARPRT